MIDFLVYMNCILLCIGASLSVNVDSLLCRECHGRFVGYYWHNYCLYGCTKESDDKAETTWGLEETTICIFFEFIIFVNKFVILSIAAHLIFLFLLHGCCKIITRTVAWFGCHSVFCKVLRPLARIRAVVLKGCLLIFLGQILNLMERTIVPLRIQLIHKEANNKFMSRLCVCVLHGLVYLNPGNRSMWYIGFMSNNILKSWVMNRMTRKWNLRP